MNPPEPRPPDSTRRLLSKIRDATGIDLMHLVKEPSPLPYPIALTEFLEALHNRPRPTQCNACELGASLPDHGRFCAKCGRRLFEDQSEPVWAFTRRRAGRKIEARRRRVISVVFVAPFYWRVTWRVRLFQQGVR